ncbi:MAG: hypothetical protein ACFCD0_20370 [Gemmataceae bacterium]
MQHLKLGLSTMLIYWLTTAPVSAVQYYYSDRNSFREAVAFYNGTLDSESFEGSFGRQGPSTFEFEDFSVSETNGLLDIVTRSIRPSAVTDGDRAIRYFDDGNSVGTFFSFDTEINAFGVDLNTGFHVDVTIGGSVAPSQIVETPTFFGVIDTHNSFNTITFDAEGFGNVYFDHAEYGLVSPSVVPVPPSLAMVGIGIATISLSTFRRRRLRKQKP